jgi:hypothetical protein
MRLRFSLYTGFFDSNLDWTAAMYGDVTDALLDLINVSDHIE